MLDPCCGSGHFLVAALRHLAPIRMAEEGLPATDAVDAVLRDNLHGLEIDERCCQIAAFALAFAAWTYPDAGGYRELPDLHIACTGIGPRCSADQWVELAEQSGIPMPTIGRNAIKAGLLNLHRLFSQAPTLGSLIDPAELPSDLIAADYETIQPYLAAVLKAEKADDETRERAIAAAGMVKAADLLAGEYTLVITNVPYLGRRSHGETLRYWAQTHHREAKADLATLMYSRSLRLVGVGGTTAAVMPQNWRFLVSYRDFRTTLLQRTQFAFVAALGANSFDSISGEVVNVVLFATGRRHPSDGHRYLHIEANDERGPTLKANALAQATPIVLEQSAQMDHPDATILASHLPVQPMLSDYAHSYAGIACGDASRFQRTFWELCCGNAGWEFQQVCETKSEIFGGREHVFLWENGTGEFASYIDSLDGRMGGSWRRGAEAWGKNGVAVARMGSLSVALYCGDLFDQNMAVLLPNNQEHLPAIWAFAKSNEFPAAVRRINPNLAVSTATLAKIPFDLRRWSEGASAAGAVSLPEPETDDPTQWLFHGHPYEADDEKRLHVAVARLLGYRWPAELDPDMRLSERAREIVKECEELLEFADGDGIVCIPSVRGEEPAAERLFALLTACDIEPGVNLDDWLRNSFFQEHCGLFHHRPFVWHIWDGRKRDGFHALVNYHKLCEGDGKGRKLLESLTYSYLGEWITRQTDGVKRGEGGAEDRLAAAVELQNRLKSILEGEPPFDLFVRWKPLAKQPIGWEPDINDGVRMNIRPFLASDLPDGRKGAGVLRYKPNIKWKKDRGKEPERPKAEYPWFWGWDEATEDVIGSKTFDGNRWNACHYTNKAKQAAGEAAREVKRV